MSAWVELLGLTVRENARAVQAEIAAQRKRLEDLRDRGAAVLRRLQAEGRVGIGMLGRVYQHGTGLNHGFFEEFRKLGYPVLSQTSLPMDPEAVGRAFGSDHPLDIEDVWKHSFSASTSQKVWAAKFVARHPNLVGIRNFELQMRPRRAGLSIDPGDSRVGQQAILLIPRSRRKPALGVTADSH